MTAQELLYLLAADPSYQAAQAKRDAELAAFVAQFADEEKMIAGEARALGYIISSVWDFVNNNAHPILEPKFTGDYDLAYPMLVRHLRIPHHHRVREGVIRALTVRDGGDVVWKALLYEFQRETDESLRWVLANALKVAMPYRKRINFPEIADTHKRSTT